MTHLGYAPAIDPNDLLNWENLNSSKIRVPFKNTPRRYQIYVTTFYPLQTLK